MTVAELIEKLREMPAGASVEIGGEYGIPAPLTQVNFYESIVLPSGVLNGTHGKAIVTSIVDGRWLVREVRG